MAAGRDLVLYGTEPAPELLACVDAAEEAGLDGVWVGDSQVLWRELHVLLGAVAARTRRLRIGPGVTNPVTRHASVTAGALATLAELTGGRAVLGAGLGDSAVRTAGLRPARLADLERFLADVRRLWSGGRDGLGYADGRLAIPVHVGASGPRMLALAGRSADGCLAVVGLSARQLDAARARVREGLAEAGRDPGSFELTFWVPFSVSEDDRRAREDVKAYVARSLQHPLPAPLTPLEQEAAERIRAEYAFVDHLTPGAAHSRLVPDEIVADWAIAGTPDECGEQLRALEERVPERLAFVPIGRDPKLDLVRRLVDDVLGD